MLSLSDADAAPLASVGPKAATLARLAHAGLRVPDAVCLTADAYRAHMTAFGLESPAAAVAGAADAHHARRLALEGRLRFLRAPLDPGLADVLAAASTLLSGFGALVARRSSALCGNTGDASFPAPLR